MNNKFKMVFVFVLFSAAPVCAQSGYEIPTYDNLTTSLTGLKESAQKIEARNFWLKEQTQLLNQQFSDLQGYLSTLEHKKDELYQNLEKINSVPAIPRAQEKDNKSLLSMKDVRAKINEAINQQAVLETELEIKRKTNETLARALSETSSAFEAKKKEIKEITLAPVSEGFIKDKGHWIDSITKLEREVKESERSLAQANKGQAKPFQQLSIIENRNTSLKQEITFLKEELKSLLDQETEINSEIDQFNARKESSEETLGQSVEELKKRRQELQNILKEAKAKLGAKAASLDLSENEIGELKQNFKTVENANLSLKDTYQTLENTLESLKLSD